VRVELVKCGDDLVQFGLHGASHERLEHDPEK
jgi:hypothetical protein